MSGCPESFKKDGTGPLNVVHSRPPSGRNSCPAENSEKKDSGSRGRVGEGGGEGVSQMSLGGRGLGLI